MKNLNYNSKMEQAPVHKPLWKAALYTTISNLDNDENNSGNTSTSQKLKATLVGNIDTKAKVGSYIESGIKSIQYGATNITNSSQVSIKYQIVNNNNITNYTTRSALETAVNKLPAGTYTINYIITYQNEELTKVRNITLS